MSQHESFQKEFNKLRDLGSSTFVLRGSTMIVELMPQEELKIGSLFVATTKDHARGESVTAHKIDVWRVLMTGPGYWQEDGTYIPLDVRPGAIVILGKHSVDFLSMFPGIIRPTGNTLGLVKEDAVLASYPTEEAYERAKRELNS